MTECIDCHIHCPTEEAAKAGGWGWSYGPEGTLWVCGGCLEERELERLEELEMFQ